MKIKLRLYFLIILFIPCSLQNLAYCATLNQENWDYDPSAHSDATESISINGGISDNIAVEIKLANRFSGIAAGLLLNGVNVLAGRSAAGAAWQTSYLLKDPNNNDIYVFNQAAGNSTPFSWGYSTYFTKVQEEYIAITNWLPLYADHKHPGGDFSQNTVLCPGYGYSSIAVDDGIERIDLTKMPVCAGNVIKIKKTYTHKSKVNQSWSEFDLEQAFYLDRQVAHDKNLHAYLGYSSDVNHTNVYDVYLGGPNYSVPSEIVYDSQTISNKSYKIMTGLKYVVFVWNISGKNIGVAINMPENPKFSFGGAHLNTERTAYGSDPNNYSNGNISFHPWIDELHGTITFNQNETNDYYLNYYVGTPEQLSELGYITKNNNTYFLGGNLLDANNWTNGLPDHQIAIINSNGYYNGVAQNNTWLEGAKLTVGGGATLSLSADLAVFCSTFTVNNATVNCNDDFFCDNGNVILNAGSVTTANDDWEANDHAGRITVNGGTHSSGTNSGNYVGAQGNSSRIGCGIDFRGGTVIAGDFRFQAYSSSSISGEAILTSATPATTIVDLSGDLNFISGWNGYWEVGAFGPGDWKTKLTSGSNITLDNTPIDATRFDTQFNVSQDGTTLKYSFSTSATYFLGGDLLNANNWTHGLPDHQEAVINVNGYYNNIYQNNTWIDGSTLTVSGGAVLSLDKKLAVKNCTSFTVNNATINCSDDFFCDGGNVILNAGSLTTANDDWEANYDAGRITVNGGTHSSGTASGNYVGAQGSSSKIGCGIDFRGGTVVAGDFRFQAYSSSSIGGGAILTSATPATTIVDLSGNLNFISGWTGYWEVGAFGPGDWKTKLTSGSNITLDNTPIDATRFDTQFNVSQDGTTLRYIIPEPAVLLSGLLLGLAPFLNRR